MNGWNWNPEEWNRYWQGGWPGEAMTEPFREWVGQEAGWQPAMSQLYGDLPLDVNWSPGGGGGGWLPWVPGIQLGGPMLEPAIHEFSHARYHNLNKDFRDRLVMSMFKLAAEPDPQYEYASSLAKEYVYGNPETGFPGMRLEEPGGGAGPRDEWNDWEMFAGLSSGIMGNLELLPPYMREMFDFMFTGKSQWEPPREQMAFPPWQQYQQMGGFVDRTMQSLPWNRQDFPRGMTAQERERLDELYNTLIQEWARKRMGPYGEWGWR